MPRLSLFLHSNVAVYVGLELIGSGLDHELGSIPRARRVYIVITIL